MKNSTNTNKKIVQDIVPGKRSIRNIDVPARTSRFGSADVRKTPRDIVPPVEKPKITKQEKITPDVQIAPKKTSAPVFDITPRVVEKKPEIDMSEKPDIPEHLTYKYEYDEPKRPSKKILYFSTGVLLLAIAFGISAFFKSATIRVTPQSKDVPFDETFIANKDSAGNSLSYQIVTVSKDVNEDVSATGQQKVSKKAQGKIIVYNTNTTAQKLVANTRFQTPEGLIFLSASAVTVPGSQMKSGKSVAGSVEVVVVAKEAGDTYNIGMKDFTIPGFKGTAKFTQVYARSKTEMSGGFVGMQKTVSQDALSQADTDLEVKLRTSLSNEILSQIPADFILYKESISYSFIPAEVGAEASSTNDAIVQKKGTATAIIFDKGSLSRSIINKVLPDATNDPVKITNLDSFQFSLPDGSTFNPGSSVSLSFNLKGNANFVWTFDENKLQADLFGLKKSTALSLISTYPSIKEAWIETKPFWNTTIPMDSKKVTFINTLEKP
ncbi:MAG: hypothetical protein WCK48_02625 [bacterium]